MKIEALGRKIEVNAGTVRANLVTRRVVVRVTPKGESKAKLALLVGTSAAKNVKRKVFARTELFDGLRLSVGRIRKAA